VAEDNHQNAEAAPVAFAPLKRSTYWWDRDNAPVFAPRAWLRPSANEVHHDLGHDHVLGLIQHLDPGPY